VVDGRVNQGYKVDKTQGGEDRKGPLGRDWAVTSLRTMLVDKHPVRHLRPSIMDVMPRIDREYHGCIKEHAW
jgi:hypothetical protein